MVNTDILITDFSSIIIEFFITGRPVIYCADTNLKFEKVYRDIIKGFYIAHKWEDVEKYVSNLLKGIDPLKERRKSIIQDIMRENQHTTESIIDYIYNDYLT